MSNFERKKNTMKNGGIIQRIKAVFRRESQDGDDRPVRMGGRLYAGGAPMSVAAVYRCVQLISDSVACLTLQYMRLRDGRFAEDENSPLHYLLTVEPQPEMNVVDFWAMAVRQMLLVGNAYIYPRYVDGVLTDLVLCRSHTVAHDALNGIYAIADPWSGVCGEFRESEIIHLYLYSHDGRNGVSVIENARQTLGIATAGDSETAKRFLNGGNVKGIIGNDSGVKGFGKYQDSELDKAAVNLDQRFQNGEHIVALHGNTSFQQISLSSADMQFLETRKFTVKEICRFFGVNPAYVYEEGSANYNSTAMAATDFMQNTLNPVLRRIEAEFTRKLIPRSLCCKRKFQWDRKGVYSLDLSARAAYQKATIESGIYSINDWRRMENQPPVEGGDDVYISTNLARLGSAKLSGGGGENQNN